MTIKTEYIIYYWLAVCLFLFTLTGFGAWPQIIASITFILSLLYLVIKKDIMLLLCTIFDAIVAVAIIVCLFMVILFFGFKIIHLLLLPLCIMNIVAVFLLGKRFIDNFIR